MKYFYLVLFVAATAKGDAPMKIYNEQVAELAKKNTDYRRELYTTDKSQLVLMSISAGDEIPKEVHDVDQILIFVQGAGEAVVDDTVHTFKEGYTLIIPAGTTHTIKNTSDEALKLYTFYTPSHHPKGTVHRTKEDEPAGY